MTKGYKVTLYSDYLRATTLYAIYINRPNLDCPKGHCEYGHYTLVFDKYLDHFMVIYLDDILVSSSNLNEHTHHVRLVLTKLCENGLYAESEKWKFNQTSVEFLGYMISPTGITMDECKVVAITDWPLPTRLKEVKSFLGFANFYR